MCKKVRDICTHDAQWALNLILLKGLAVINHDTAQRSNVTLGSRNQLGRKMGENYTRIGWGLYNVALLQN